MVNDPRRTDKALALRTAGATYEEIATVLRFRNGTAVRVAVEEALTEMASTVDRDHMRELTSRRLERLLKTVWPKAVNPEHAEHLPAVRAAKDLIDRFAKLHGLDAPAEIVVHSPTTNELTGWVSAVLAAGVPDVIEADVLEGEDDILETREIETG